MNELSMNDLIFWLVILLVGIFLWWAAYVATKRMRIGKNKEREEIARRNLERHAREQAEAAESAKTEAQEER